MSKKIIKNFTILIMIITLVMPLLTPNQAMASASKKYLVLVGQSDGTFKAFDDLVVEMKGKIMMKAKPLASALDATYSDRTDSEKGCIIESGNVTNTYTLNSKTVIWKTGADTVKYEAPVEQSYDNSDNLIYYDTVRSFMNVSYFKASKAPAYKRLGYTGGVIVYNFYKPRPTLPATSSIIAWNNQISETTMKTTNIKLNPVVRDELVFEKYACKNIRVEFYDCINAGKSLFDYQPVQEIYKNNQLPGDGIYGLGHCNDPLIIQGLDSQGNVLKEYETTNDVFLIDLPGASKLCIINKTAKDPLTHIVFTPVKPVVITDSSKISFKDINWLTVNGLATQYFVLPEYFETTIENNKNFQSIGSCHIETDKPDNNSSNNSDSLTTVTVESKDNNLTAENIYINFNNRVTLPLIDNSNVCVYDTSKDLWAADYESKLTDMLNAVKQYGTNNYFPAENFNHKAIIRSQSMITSNAGDEQIMLTPENFNLDCAEDYLTHLHEMTHFFEAQNTDYGWMIPAWPEGIAEALSRQALSNMKITPNGDIHQFTKINLTPAQVADFETYYLSITNYTTGNDTAYNIGYNFITYLQKTYGADIVCKIYKAEMNANIPQKINEYYCRDKERDKLFTGCIKSVTSKNVFQDFVTYYQSLN